MRKFAKILIPAFLLIAVVMSMSILSVSAAPEELTLEWLGGTQDQAVAFLNNAMVEAEAGKEVKVVLKADMSFTSPSRNYFYHLGTDAVTDTTVTITGDVNGSTRYGIVLDKFTVLNFKGNVTFKDIALTGARKWSDGSSIIVSEGTGTFGENNESTNYGGLLMTNGKEISIAGKNIKAYTGYYYSVAGNLYNNKNPQVAIDSPTLVLAGNATAIYVIGRQQDLGGGNTVTGNSNVSILDKASVTTEVTAGNSQGSTCNGGGTLTLNTTGTIANVYLATSNGASDCNFLMPNGERSTFTLNVLGGRVSGSIYLYGAQSGTAKNFNAVFNFGNAEYENMIWTGWREINNTDTNSNGYKWGGAVTDCDVEVNITGGTFYQTFYAGSRFEYTYTQSTGSYENINRTINISGNPTFKKWKNANNQNVSADFCGGSYVKYGQNPHRGNTVINISGGTFENSVYGGSRLLTSAGTHSGNVTMKLTGGTFKNHIYAGAYLSCATAKMTGASTLEIAGAITQSGGGIGAGSIMTAAGAVHSGETNIILSANADSSISGYGIMAGGYLDGGSHNASGNIIIKGSADWKTGIYGGSFAGPVTSTAGTADAPTTINITVDKNYTGTITKLVAGERYNGSKGKNVTSYSNITINVEGGKVAAVYGHETTYNTNKNVGTTNINLVGGTTLSAYAFSSVDTGADVNINIADTAKRVVKAQGSADETVIPENAYLTYSRKAIRDDEISGFKAERVVANGDVSSQPDVYMPTIYISANGTGDGSSPESPLGNVAGYDPLAPKGGAWDTAGSCDAYKGNVLYRAFEELAPSGGRIVLVGPVYVDTAASRVESWKKNQGPSEFTLPTSQYPVIVTSVFDGVDYAAKNGAKLILDQDKCNVMFLVLGAPVTFEKLTIEHKYDETDLNSWKTPAVIAANGKKVVVESTVKVTAWNAKTNSAGDWYPGILGGHRINVNVASTDLTIKAGNWSFVGAACYGMNYATAYGKVTGNATLNIEGGYIKEVYGTSATSQPYASVGGKLTINVTGGLIEGLYASAKNGAENEIVVNISKDVERVYKAYGCIDEAKAPANATITYDRSVIRDDEVINWTKVNANGKVEDQPKPYVPTIYIAANGKGDGSSPDSPLGNIAGYDPLALKLDKDGKLTTSSDAYYGNAFYRAFDKLKSTGGMIVIVGPVSIDTAASRIESAGKNQSPSEFFLPVVNGDIVITSVHEGVDYAATNGAKLILDQDKCAVTFLEFKNPVTFENITIEHRYDATDKNNWNTPFAIAACANELVIGENVKVTAWDAKNGAEGDWYPMILGGSRFANFDADTNVTIKSGNWSAVYAGSFGMGANYPGNINGNATVNIEGGNVEAIYGTTSPKYASGKITGKLEINVTGGTVASINLTQKNGAENEIVVNIAKTAERVTRIYGSSSEASAPSNVTINYDRSVIRDDEIFYCGNTKPTGKLEDQPVKYMPTIYIAADGKGDGSSPESPLGNVEGYDPFALKLDKDGKPTTSSDAYKGNALYRAISQLTAMGGRIVLVGPVSIDTAASRIESSGKGQSPSELTLPATSGEIVITSNFDGVDYAAKNGAKLILDQDKCCVTFLEFQSPVTFDNLTIEHRYDPNDTNSWGTPFAIAARGNKLVVEDNVTVTAWNTVKNLQGNWYPMILGGSRFTTFKANTNVTIKSGNWSAVYAGSYGMGTTYPGNIEGNATVNIMGGKIDTVYGTTDPKYASGKITGKLEINVTGGYVGAIFATQKNGAANEIVVNIAATADRVAKVWGGVSDASVPTNGTINYDRSVTRDDEVKYWTTVNYTGNVEDQPEPVYFTVYVADVEKGLGDGSSPENAIGHAEGYAKLRKQALAIIKANGGTNSKLSKENNAIVTSVYKQNALYRALSYNGGKLVKQGGKLVVCGTLTVDATDAMRKALADFWGPTGSAEVIITSNDGKTNYRAKGAKLVLDNSELGLCVELGSPTTFDHITIEHKYNSKNGKGLSNGAIIAGRGNKLTIGYNVKVIATDVNPDEEARIEMYPTIIGGHRYSDSKSDNYVIISSGQWAAVVGGDYGSAHTGNATIGINGGKIGTICGTTNPTNSNKKHIFNGSVWIGLWGGEVDNIYVVGKPGMIWGDASIGLGGTKINGKVRATHPDYEGDEIQSWVFNYTDKQVNTDKVIGFENPVPATGSALPYLAVVATVSLVGAAALIVTKKKKTVND